MTIHSAHPFADPEPARDPVRRLRGRLATSVTLWTAGAGPERAGLTVSSVVVAAGDPGRVLGLLDPEADLTAGLTDTGRGVVQVLGWADRDLAEMFAGTAPAPGGAFTHADFEDTAWGPRLARAATWAGVVVEDVRPVGWSLLVTTVVESVTIGDEPGAAPLLHRRGRWTRPAG